jgi:hypothetical protein
MMMMMMMMTMMMMMVMMMMMTTLNRFTKAKQVGILHYEGALESEPEGDPTWEELHNEGLVSFFKT